MLDEKNTCLFPLLETQIPRRVSDLIDPNLKEKDIEKYNKTIRLWDKGFEQVTLHRLYDEAIKKGDEIAAKELRKKIYEALDVAYIKFATAILKEGIPFKTICGKTTGDWLEIIKIQMNNAKNTTIDKHPRDVIEFVLIKLSILRDVSRIYEFDTTDASERIAGKVYIDLKSLHPSAEDIMKDKGATHKIRYETKDINNVLVEGFIVAATIVPRLFSSDITEKATENFPKCYHVFLRKTAEMGHTIKNPISKKYIISVYIAAASSCEDEPHTKSFENYLNHILTKPLLENTALVRKAIGPGFHTLVGKNKMEDALYLENYASNHAILPQYSSNGSMGINAMLYAIFCGYLCVGYGENPLSVHGNLFEKQAYATARHDYVHAIIWLLPKLGSGLFNSLRNVYFNLPHEYAERKIDEKTLKKELIVLFYLVNEHSIESQKSYQWLELTTMTHTRGIDESNMEIDPESRNFALLYKQRKMLDKEKRLPLDSTQYLLQPYYKKAAKDNIFSHTVSLTIDWVKPLQEIGYEFPGTIGKMPWEAASVLRKALLTLLTDFRERRPECFTGETLPYIGFGL